MIKILGCGGTIACERVEGKYAPVKSAETLFELYPNLKEDIEFIQVMNKDSSNMKPSDWEKIAEAVHSNWDDCEGIVITHGTDTMPYTACYLSFALQNLDKPVVITGAQLPPDVENTDARENLYDALQVAKSDLGEVVISFHGKIVRGTRAAKVRVGKRKSDFEAYDSINFPNLGEVVDSSVKLNENAKRRMKGELVYQNHVSDKIKSVRVHPFITANEFNDEGYDGVVVMGFSAGFLPTDKALRDRLLDVSSRKPVVITSGCRYGQVLSSWEVSATEFVPAYDMTPECAEVKLAWLLGSERELKETKELFTQNLVGELTKYDLEI